MQQVELHLRALLAWIDVAVSALCLAIRIYIYQRVVKCTWGRLVLKWDGLCSAAAGVHHAATLWQSISSGHAAEMPLLCDNMQRGGVQAELESCCGMPEGLLREICWTPTDR